MSAARAFTSSTRTATDYLDLLSGIGVNALGYGHPAIERAIINQSRALIHTSNLFFHEGQAELALRLTERTGLDRVFFANTGTEAWEGALKLARAHAGLLRSEGKNIGTKFLALEQSFHGRTMGSVSTTYKAKYREPFGPVVPGVEFVRFNDVADLRAKFSNEVCAICVEAIQGEGGIRPLTQEFFAEARALASSTGALAHRRRDSVGHGPHRQVVRLPALRHSARHHHAGQAHRRRHSSGRHALHRRSGARHSCRACMAPHSAAARWPAPSPSPSSTRSKTRTLLAHVDRSRRLLPAAASLPGCKA